MYIPRHFEETRVDVLHQLMRAEPFAMLVTLGPGGLNANHLPLELDPEPAPFGTLRGHVSRANEVWRATNPSVESLVVFQGSQRYITPAWYPTKEETGKVVPTWNYVVVHGYGTPRFIEDPAWLRAHIERLTAIHETGRERPWQVGDAPDDYVAGLVRGIVGFEMPLTRLQGKWKVSENRNEADRAGITSGLRATVDPASSAMADLVERRT
ncbi:MAG: FMN-binding negative transcriptional regulator [Vicinamibacteraceae bacterium]